MALCDGGVGYVGVDRLQWYRDADHADAVGYAGDTTGNPPRDHHPSHNANSKFHAHIHADTYLNTASYPNPRSNVYSQAYVAARSTGVNWDAYFAITRADQRR